MAHRAGRADKKTGGEEDREREREREREGGRGRYVPRAGTVQ
jgi:hypothetical protein